MNDSDSDSDPVITIHEWRIKFGKMPAITSSKQPFNELPCQSSRLLVLVLSRRKSCYYTETTSGCVLYIVIFLEDSI